MTKYIIIVALGALSYGTLSSFAKISYGEGYNAAEITFAQASIGAIILWTATFLKKLRSRNFVFKGNWKLILAGTSIGLSAYCFYLSVKYIPVSLAIVLLMQVSWISILFEWFFFKKKPSFAELLATLIIVAGTVLAGNMLQLQILNLSITGIMLALTAALIYALYILSTSRLSNQTSMFEKSAMMVTGSALIIFTINFKTITASTHFDIGLLKWGTFLAIFGTVIPPICFTTGMPKIGASLSSILLTLELPAVVFCAHIILGEQVSVLQMVGIAIMIAAIIYLNLTKNKPELRKRKAFMQKATIINKCGNAA